MTTLAELQAAMATAGVKPLHVRNDKLQTRQHKLSDLVELHAYLASLDAVDSSATQIDAETAVMPGVRTNRLLPGGGQ